MFKFVQAGYFLILLLSSADFFQTFFLSLYTVRPSFEYYRQVYLTFSTKNISGTLSECQTVFGSRSGPGLRGGLKVQTVCKGYQQTTKVEHQTISLGVVVRSPPPPHEPHQDGSGSTRPEVKSAPESSRP